MITALFVILVATQSFYSKPEPASAQPELAIKSANLLDTLMPSVTHITHMPSHIYIRTGEYQRGVKFWKRYRLWAKTPVIAGKK